MTFIQPIPPQVKEQFFAIYDAGLVATPNDPDIVTKPYKSIKHLANELGIHPNTARRWLDARSNPSKYLSHPSGIKNTPHRERVDEGWVTDQLRTYHRALVQARQQPLRFMFGDPLPGRSVLDQRTANEIVVSTTKYTCADTTNCASV
jgi:hypothetical protein